MDSMQIKATATDHMQAAMGAILFGGITLDLLAIAIGIDALLLHCRGRRKLFAVLGIASGSAFLIFVLCMGCVGFAVTRRGAGQ
jgi:hypothetical protein